MLVQRWTMNRLRSHIQIFIYEYLYLVVVPLQISRKTLQYLIQQMMLEYNWLHTGKTLYQIESQIHLSYNFWVIVLGDRTLYRTKFNPILMPERGLQKKNKIMPLKYSHFILKEDEQRVGEVIRLSTYDSMYTFLNSWHYGRTVKLIYFEHL